MKLTYRYTVHGFSGGMMLFNTKDGEWDFDFDFSKSGLERRLFLTENFDKLEKLKINVPFCPESRLSGIGYTDFIPAVWYKRDFTLTEEECLYKICINFGAVDYKTKIWVNGNFAGEHIGGYSSFSFDITDFVKAGDNDLVIHALCLYLAV